MTISLYQYHEYKPGFLRGFEGRWLIALSACCTTLTEEAAAWTKHTKVTIKGSRIMVTTERGYISICYGKINKQIQHPKCFDMFFEKKRFRQWKQNLCLPSWLFPKLQFEFRQKDLTWNLNENLSIIYFISYSSRIYQNIFTKYREFLTFKSKNIKRFFQKELILQKTLLVYVTKCREIITYIFETFSYVASV